MLYLVVIEIEGKRRKETDVFFCDRSQLIFGRSGSVNYRLLSQRPEWENRGVSRVHATAVREYGQHEGVKVYPGALPPIAALEKPRFWENGNPIDVEFVELGVRDQICIYQDLSASVSIKLMDDSDPDPIVSNEMATQPFDLQEATLSKVNALESQLAQVLVLIETLATADREVRAEVGKQNKHLRKIKISGASALLIMALLSGGQLLDTETRKDLSYRSFELLFTLISTGGSTILFRDSIDKRR